LGECGQCGAYWWSRVTVRHAFVRLRIINFRSERGNQAGIHGGMVMLVITRFTVGRW